MNPPFRDNTSLVGSSGERSSILLRSLRGNIFSGDDSFEEHIAWSWKSSFLEKERRGREVRPSVPKICSHKNCEQKFVSISNTLHTISNICYRITNLMSSDLISDLKTWPLTWKINLGGWGHCLECLFFARDLKVLVLCVLSLREEKTLVGNDFLYLVEYDFFLW